MNIVIAGLAKNCENNFKKNIEYLNNKYLKLKPLHLKDISFIKNKNTFSSEKLVNANFVAKEIN